MALYLSATGRVNLMCVILRDMRNGVNGLFSLILGK